MHKEDDSFYRQRGVLIHSLEVTGLDWSGFGCVDGWMGDRFMCPPVFLSAANAHVNSRSRSHAINRLLTTLSSHAPSCSPSRCLQLCHLRTISLLPRLMVFLSASLLPPSLPAGYHCAEASTARILEQIIQETTNRMNRYSLERGGAEREGGSRAGGREGGRERERERGGKREAGRQGGRQGGWEAFISVH